MAIVNWKRFINEYKYLKAWLDQYGCGNSDAAVLKIMALILRGDKEPYKIAASAISRYSLPDILTVELSNDCRIEFSAEFNSVVTGWIVNVPKNAMFLGEFYEKVSSGKRKRGVYYTPLPAIEFILSHTVAHCDIVKQPYVKVLDPACGCGYFLLKAYDVLWAKFIQYRAELTKKYPALDWSDAGIHRHILSNNLWGSDIDPVAVEITRVCLQLKRPQCKENCKSTIIVSDSLKRPVHGDAAEKNMDFWSKRYEYIVGNPPYVSFGLRGAASMDAAYKGYLRNEYMDSAEYKLSYYVLFMQRGIELLAHNGRMAYIVPDSFLLGRYYSKIREYILRKTAIDAIACIHTTVFGNASVGYCAIGVFAEQSNAVLRESNVLNVYKVTDINTLTSVVPSCSERQKCFSEQPYHRFRIFFDDIAREIVEKIESAGSSLKCYASGHTGIRSLSKQKDIIALHKKGRTWQQGLVSGRQICRYGLQYNGHWLNINADALYKGGWKEEVVKQRKILIRQTGDTLIASIDNQGFYHLNNIHSFILNCGSPVSLEYLLLIINSRLFSFYYHATTMEYGRSMAQTDIETLELLPIAVNAELNNRSADIVSEISSCVKADLSYTKDFAVLNAYINTLVYRLYHLTSDEIEYIEQWETLLTEK